MSTPVRIGIPVALHEEGEIQAFLEAKPRIERLTAAYGLPSDVGVFAYYTPRLIGPTQREQQLKNQERHKLPIFHAQTPIFGTSSLAYDGEGLLETTIDHVAQLCAMSNSKNCSVDTHIGVVVNEHHTPLPEVYTPSEALTQRDAIFARAQQRFAQLTARAAQYGMSMLLENQITAQFAPGNGNATPQLHYLPFNDLASIERIAGTAITCDVAHWAATRHAQAQFEHNGIEPATLFAISGVANWDEYHAANGTLYDLLARSQAIHLSNTAGIGVHLERTPELAKQWGDWGTNSGLLSAQELRESLVYGALNDVPVMIEVDYDIKRIAENKFTEADAFLTHLFTY
jgi:hypothetical protein